MKNLELPERWWRRWDNHPGTIRWWAEYYVWKFTGLCHYPNTSAPNHFFDWVYGGEGCDEGMEAERSVLNPSLWSPAEIVERPETHAEHDEIMKHNHDIGFEPTFHDRIGDPVLHIPLEYEPVEPLMGWDLPPKRPGTVSLEDLEEEDES